MKKSKEEIVENEITDFEIDDSPNEEIVIKDFPKEPIEVKAPKAVKKQVADEDLVSCLRNERIVVRHIPRETLSITNPKHVLYGGMAETAVRTFVVPRLSSGIFVNVLTDSEKAFLENIMGLEYNALSIYRKDNNYWDDSNEECVASVRLLKQDNYLDLSVPEDYIKYKILLANKDYIAPSIQALNDYPKATYQFVIISEGEEVKNAHEDMSTTMKCYKEFGKIENDFNTLRVIVETIEGKPTAPNIKIEFLQTKINSLIQADSKLFLKVISDKNLPAKVLIKKSLEAGLLSKRGNYYYLRSDNTPLCEHDEEPTLTYAAKYLNSPKHQEMKLSLEAKLK